MPVRFELPHDRPGEVDRDGKPYSGVATRAAVNRAVDAYHLTARIEERTAGVAGIYGCVRLNETVVTSSKRSSFRAHDAGGHCEVEPERIADRHDPIAHLYLVRITE